ncbi:hypothetical protein PoB_006355400, partial [Plakobranchus ocellatus]
CKILPFTMNCNALELDFCAKLGCIKVISGLKALGQAGAIGFGVKATIEGSLHISGSVHYLLCHQRLR